MSRGSSCFVFRFGSEPGWRSIDRSSMHLLGLYLLSQYSSYEYGQGNIRIAYFNRDVCTLHHRSMNCDSGVTDACTSGQLSLFQLLHVLWGHVWVWSVC